jgi:ubiquitin carboxyl-terminal hydrolase 14
MNSTIQVLRQIPELKESLTTYTDNINSMNPERRLVASLRDLYAGMDKAATEYPPLMFWQMLRTFRPQFDQQDNHGHFAQQDAEECWSSVVAALKGALGDHFVDHYMSGKLVTTTSSVEAPDEQPTVREEPFVNLTCSINSTTNYLSNGLKDGFTQQIEKNSPTLGRNAIYTSTSAVSRAPSYLAVHLNRFFWRPDIRKKTKIMRRVKFPMEFDLTEIMSEDLKKKVRALNARTKEIEKDRFERMRVLKRTKKDNKEEVDDWMTEEEKKKREEEKEELEKLIDPDLKADVGACASGMYDLQAILTHKGSDANSGKWWSRGGGIVSRSLC